MNLQKDIRKTPQLKSLPVSESSKRGFAFIETFL